VISSFLAAFPINRPKYVVYVLLFEPKPTQAAGGEVLAGLNAAPTTARIIERIGPLLGILPRAAAVSGPGMTFDAAAGAKYQAR
jgi:cell division protein FtsI (penicillin-binding protein 3)